jgi:membrane protein YqaA with SNARE-associated domain
LSAAGHRIGLWLAGFVWGLAEATAFFVVPDVLLTFVAQRRGLFSALVVALFVVAGAMLGGLAMWWIGGAYPAAVAGFLDHIPAISRAMIEEAGKEQARDPFAALLAGAFSGAPYKVFAATAQAAGVSLIWFLLITIPARAARFVVAIVATVVIDGQAARWLGPRTRFLVLAGFWVAFYAVFWAVMPG